MGLDIYKYKVLSKEEADATVGVRINRISALDEELKENKSLAEVFEKFKDKVQETSDLVYDIVATANKYNIPGDWFYVGSHFENNVIVLRFSEDDFNKPDSNIQTIDVLETDAVKEILPVYELFIEETGYQRKDVFGNMYDEFFGGGDEYFGIHYTIHNEVLDVAKTYTYNESPMYSWVLNDDEFVEFSF